MILLAGDIGGTKTWLQIADYSSDASLAATSTRENFTVLFEERYISDQYDTFDTLLVEFLQTAQQHNVPYPEKACIGVAGPVEKRPLGHDVAKVTNLPWVLDAQQLVKQHKFRHLSLINDFQAIAFGLEMLTTDDVMVLQAGKEVVGATIAPKVVIGAGTGLGQALLVWQTGMDGDHYAVIPSEGGHGDFAPSSNHQRELLSYLSGQQERVSVEDVLSGRGLVNIYRYLADKYPSDDSETLRQAMKDGDAAAAVSKAGVLSPDSLAGRALVLFVEIYGSQAGNFALNCMATGGVYIAGGIAAKMLDSFSDNAFLSAFHNKGPMQHLMESIPVTLVLDPQVGLKGAALVASRL